MEWTRAQRKLHWWTASIVVLVFPIGFLMVEIPFYQLVAKFFIYQLHKTLGIIVFAIAVVRLGLRARVERPMWDPAVPGPQLKAAALVHALLYLLLVITPILGYLVAATASARVPTLFLGVIPVPHLVGVDKQWFTLLLPIHRLAAILLLLLAAGHAGMAVYHHLRGRGTLVRMWRGDPVAKI